MESKFQAEMEEHKQKLDKEYEGTRQNFMLEIERLKKKMVQELEKKVQMFQFLELVANFLFRLGRKQCKSIWQNLRRLGQESMFSLYATVKRTNTHLWKPQICWGKLTD